MNRGKSTKNVKEIQSKKMTPPLILEFNVGDLVKVCSDENEMKELQNCKDCGGYSQIRMQGILGSCVRVKHISQYCVKVEWENCEFDLHPKLIERIGPKSVSTRDSNEIRDKHAELLFEAIEAGDHMLFIEKLKTYLLNTQSSLGQTPLNAVCVTGHLGIAETLIQLDANLDIPDNKGNLPVNNCVLSNHLNILKLILDKNGNQLHSLDLNGRTLLHLAAMTNNYEITKYLIEKNINPDIKDLSGRIASQYINNATNQNINRLLTNVNSIVRTTQVNSYPTISISRDNVIDSVPDSRDRYARGSESSNILSKEESESYTIVPPSVSPIQPSVSPIQNVSDNGNEGKKIECEICCNRMKAVAFISCGHTSCKECADRLFRCHICQKEIVAKHTIIYNY